MDHKHNISLPRYSHLLFILYLDSEMRNFLDTHFVNLRKTITKKVNNVANQRVNNKK